MYHLHRRFRTKLLCCVVSPVKNPTRKQLFEVQHSPALIPPRSAPQLLLAELGSWCPGGVEAAPKCSTSRRRYVASQIGVPGILSRIASLGRSVSPLAVVEWESTAHWAHWRTALRHARPRLRCPASLRQRCPTHAVPRLDRRSSRERDEIRRRIKMASQASQASPGIHPTSANFPDSMALTVRMRAAGVFWGSDSHFVTDWSPLRPNPKELRTKVA